MTAPGASALFLGHVEGCVRCFSNPDDLCPVGTELLKNTGAPIFEDAGYIRIYRRWPARLVETDPAWLCRTCGSSLLVCGCKGD